MILKSIELPALRAPRLQLSGAVGGLAPQGLAGPAWPLNWTDSIQAGVAKGPAGMSVFRKSAEMLLLPLFEIVNEYSARLPGPTGAGLTVTPFPKPQPGVFASLPPTLSSITASKAVVMT